jgi:ABC-2 type transport system ATP-binding protein
MSDSLLSCEQIFVSYDGVRRALSDVSMEVHAGQVLGLVGPNGAGKSTTLRVLATLQSPDRGRVCFEGLDAWPRRHEVRECVGFLGDGTSMYPKMEAAKYLEFFAECYGLAPGQARERAAALLGQFGLESKATAKVATLSKGMRQRLAIARTMVQRPQVLLLDEPADGLDPHGRRALRELLRSLADDGTAIVISSHILRELDDLCDAIAVLERGRVAVQGSVADIIEQYEVGRRVYQIEVRVGMAAALELLKRRECMVESIEAIEGDAEPTNRGLVHARLQEEHLDAASLLRAMVEAGVEVSSFGKVRSDLEDVYESLGRDDLS